MTLPPHLFRQLALGIGLCTVFYAALVALEDGAAVRAAFSSLGWQGWLIILGLSLLNYGLRYLRWAYYLRRLGAEVPAGTNLLAYIAGFGFTTTPGKVGEAMRSVYLRPHGVDYTRSLAAFFVERMVDMLAMLLIAALALFAFAELRWLVIVTLLVTLGALPLVHSRYVGGLLDRLAASRRSPRLAQAAAHLLELLRAAAPLLRSGPLYIGLVLGVVAWGAEGIALYVVLERMGVSFDMVLAAGIYGASIIAGVVTFVPGGLGGTELVMQYLLKSSGVAAPLAVSAVIICRVATLWFAVLLGLLAVAVLEFKGVSRVTLDAVDGGTER